MTIGNSGRRRPTASKATRALRRVKREIRAWMTRLSATRLDDRGRGQLEAMRHLATVIENAEDR